MTLQEYEACTKKLFLSYTVLYDGAILRFHNRTAKHQIMSLRAAHYSFHVYVLYINLRRHWHRHDIESTDTAEHCHISQPGDCIIISWIISIISKTGQWAWIHNVVRHLWSPISAFVRQCNLLYEQCAHVFPSFHWHLPVKGWPGWVDLVRWLWRTPHEDSQSYYYSPSLNVQHPFSDSHNITALYNCHINTITVITRTFSLVKLPLNVTEFYKLKQVPYTIWRLFC